MKTIVLGYHSLGCIGLEALLDHGFDVAAVLSHDDAPGEEVWWRSLAALAGERGIPVSTADVRDPAAEELVASSAPDFLFSFYYRSLIPDAVLAHARRGALNLHGSLLPRYRGRAPVNWVLVNGETETGVSLHYMVARPDAGDLVDQERVAITSSDTAYTLYGKLEGAARCLLDRALPALAGGTAAATPLDLAAGSYFGGRRPADGEIDWQWGAHRVYDLVRAVTHPYPGAFTWWRGERLYVWWALPLEHPSTETPGTILDVDGEGVVVAAGDGAVRLVTVQLGQQPELPASAFALWAALGRGELLGLQEVPK